MGQIIRTCNLGLLLAGVAIAAPVAATSEVDDQRAVVDYANARMAEIGDRQDEALEAYLKLHKKAPQSAVLTDRLFETAILKGDMATAVRAARAQELQDASADQSPLLFFADAYRSRNWDMAALAATELGQAGRFSFMAPVLTGWVNVARGKPHGLEPADVSKSPFVAYFSNDQRVYLDFAAGNYQAGEQELQDLAKTDLDYARDLMIRAAPVVAANGDKDFADALQSAGIGADWSQVAASPAAQKKRAKMTKEDGLAALYVRVANTLLDQNLPVEGLVMSRLAQWISPDSDPARLVLARALAAQGQQDNASRQRAMIAADSPYWGRGVSDEFEMLDAAGRGDQALAVAQAASKKVPGSARLKLLIARGQAEAGQDDAAAATYAALVEQSQGKQFGTRQQATYRLLYATALDESGHWTQAREQFDKAIALDPDNAQLLNYLGFTLLERGEEHEYATSLVERAYKLSPDSAAIADSLGWARYHAGDFPAAVTLIEGAAKKSGNDATINEHLGDAYWRAGRKVDARYAWRAASQVADGETALRLASKIDIGLPDASN